VGYQYDSIVISSNDPDSPGVGVSVSGTGMEPPDIAVSPDSLHADLFTGDTETQTLTITNEGGSDLEWDLNISSFSRAAQSNIGLFNNDIGLEMESIVNVINPFVPRSSYTNVERSTIHNPIKITASSDGDNNNRDERDGNLIAILCNYAYTGYDELTGTLIDLGYDTVKVFSVEEAVEMDAQAIISGYGSDCSTAGVTEWIESGKGFIQNGDWFNWFPIAWENTGSNAINMEIVDAEHPLAYNLPDTWEANGFWHYNGEGYLAYVQSPAFSNIARGNQPDSLAHDRVVTADQIGEGFAVFLGINIFGSEAGEESIQLFSNALQYVTGNAMVDWLSVQPTSGTIPAGSSQDVDVTFDATDMLGGDYSADIVITSNDPDEGEVIVPATLGVTGIPDIAVEPSSLDFGESFVGDTTTQYLTISNTGNDDLTVSDVQSSGSDFTVSSTSFTVSVGEDYSLRVSFSPSSVGYQYDSIVISSNDPDSPGVGVSVSGTGMEPPDIAVSPDSLHADLFTGDTETQTLTITNEGQSDLEWEIDISENRSASNNNRNIGFYADESRTPSGPVALPSNVMNRPGSNNDDGSRDEGDVLNTYTLDYNTKTGCIWMDGLIYYLDYSENYLKTFNPNTEEVDTLFAVHNAPFGIAWDGQYLWIGNNVGNVYGYDLSGNLLGSFLVPFYYYPALTWNGEYFLAAEFLSEGDPIYKLTPSGSVVASYSNNVEAGLMFSLSWVPGHDGGNLWMHDNNYMLYRLNLNEANANTELITSFSSPSYSPYGTLGHDGTDLWVMDGDGSYYYPYLYQIDDGIEEQGGWLSTDLTSGTIPAGSSQDVDVTFDATDMLGGDYSADIVITSNDPDESVVYVIATLTVDTSPPSITLNTPFTGAVIDIASLTEITWDAEDNIGINSLSLHFSINGESSWELISEVDKDATSYNWLVPNIVSNNVAIRLIGVDLVGLSDTSIVSGLSIVESYPQVLSVFPAPGRVDWSNHEFIFQFSQALDPATIIAENIEIISDYSNDDTLIITYIDSSTSIKIQTNLATMDSVTVVLSNLITNVYGLELDGDGDGQGGDSYNAEFEIGMLADFDDDNTIGLDDLAQFVMGLESDDFEYELGPFEGDIPHVTVSPDSKYDIEDVVAFAMMWNWYSSNNTMTFTSYEDEGLPILIDTEHDSIYIDFQDDLSAYQIQVQYTPGSFFIGSSDNGDDLFFTHQELHLGVYTIMAQPGQSKLIIPIEIRGRDANISISYKGITASGELAGQMTRSMTIENIPDEFVLYSNYPNPFNPITKIDYGLPEASNVQLIIYDILGREVTTLVNGVQEPGYKSITWHGTNAFGKNVGAGMYFYLIQAGDFRQAKKMVLLK
jgi:hypothetical protein